MTSWNDAGFVGMSWYAFPPLLVGLLIALQGFAALFFEKRLRVSASFFLMTLSASLWLTTYGVLFSLKNPDRETALALIRLSHIGVSFIPSCMLLFISFVARTSKPFHRAVYVCFAASIFFCIVNLRTDWWIWGAKQFFWGFYPQYSLFSVFFLVFFFGCLFAGLWTLWRGYESALSERARGRLKSLLIAFSVSSLASVDYLANFSVSFYPCGYLPVLFFILMTADTMRRYHLADMTPAFAAEKILETMQGIVVVLDWDGIVRLVNHSACESLGYKREELLGMPGSLIMDTGEKPAPGEIPLSTQLDSAGTKPRSYTMRWKTKDGKILVLSVAASVLRNRSGDRGEGVVYIAQDLSARHKLEQALEVSEDRFQLVVENVRDYAIYMLDSRGNVETWNLGAERIKGYSADEIIGAHFSKFYIEEDRREDIPRKELESAARQGFVESEGWRSRKDGSRFWGYLTITVLKNRKGAVLGYLAITRDMTASKTAEEILRESEDRFRSVTESAHDAIVSADSEGAVLSWNQGAKKIFGYQTEEVLGKPVSMLMAERFREIQHQALAQFKLTGDSGVIGRAVELTGLRKDGTEFPLELSLSTWKSARGVFFSGIIRDITERKKLEKERDSYFNLSLDMLATADRSGNFRQVNPAWEKALGWSPDELKSRPWMELIHAEDRSAARSALEGLEPMRSSVQFENRFLCKDGYYKYLFWSATLPPGDDVVFVAARDITEERKNRQIRLRLAAIVEFSNDAIIMISHDGEIRSWNRGAEKVYGYSAAEIVGESISLLFPSNRIYELKEIIESAVSNSGVENYETVGVRKGGGQLHVSLTISPIRDAAENLQAISIIGRNITKMKEAEEVLRRRKDLEMKSNFISMVSHELRTPLTVIKMGVDILRSGEAGAVNEQQMEWVDMCYRNVERLARLITKVLDFQKLESGKIEYEFKKEDINEVVTEVEKSVRLLLGAKKIDILTELAPHLPPLMIDRDKIIEVLTNLIDNALKFTPEGSVTVKTERIAGFIRLTVSDTGIGIRREDLPKLFSSFTQVHAIHHKTGGTGLGLAISKKIIEQHQGKIWVESEYEKGTSFFIELPIRDFSASPS